MSEQENKIKEIIEKLRPFLINDGGNIEFVKYVDNIVYIRMMGACANCQMLDLTLKDGIESAIMSEVSYLSLYNFIIYIKIICWI